MTTLERRPLGQLLLGRGRIHAAQLDLALAEQRRGEHQKLLGEILVELRHCTDEQIVESLAESYGLPFARLGPRLADPKVFTVLPRAFIEKHAVLPLFLVEGTLTVALPEPADVFLLEEIQRLTGRRVQVVAATARDILATARAYSAEQGIYVSDDVGDLAEGAGDTEPRVAEVGESGDPGGDGFGRDPDADAPAGDAAAAAKLVNYCLYHAVKDGASDVHLEPGEDGLRVRFRIDGRLVEKLRPPVQMHAAVAVRLKTMAGLDADQRRMPQEGAVEVTSDGRSLDLRVCCMPGRHGEKIVLHVARPERAIPNLEKLGFGYEALKQWRKLIGLPHGLILVTGPAGSGKMTTLYSALQTRAADATLNVCTIEDPIARDLPGVHQCPVDEKAGFTYAAALRSLLRQDPDVLLVGELRDPETAQLAAQAALSGHLVFTTVYANDAAGAVSRLLSLGVDPYTAGATLTGVLAQRLVRKLCQGCRESYVPSANERRQLERYAPSVPSETLYRPKGCPRCKGLGYWGRLGIHELLVPDDAMTEAITRSAPLADLHDLAKRAGVKSLRADGVEKAKAGITTLDEIYRVTA